MLPLVSAQGYAASGTRKTPPHAASHVSSAIIRFDNSRFEDRLLPLSTPLLASPVVPLNRPLDPNTHEEAT
jgi:hypothetical protein